MKIRTVGAGTVVAYFGLFYFLPIALLVVLGPHTTLNYSGDYLLLGSVVLVVFFMALLFASTGIRLPMSWAKRLPNIFEQKYFLLGIVAISLPISIQFYQSFGAGFRYSGLGLANAGFVPQFMFLYKSFYYSFVTYCFFCLLCGRLPSPFMRIILLFSSVVWALSANGSADIIWLAVSLSIAIFGDGSRKYFVREVTSGGGVFQTISRNLVLAILLIGGAVGIIFFGFANKAGIDAAIARFNAENLANVAYYLYYRISLFVASVENGLTYGIDWHFYARSIDVLHDMVNYRVQAILGLDVTKPELGGINQLNYFEIYRYPANLRSGSSPGVIASFLYLPILPLNLLLSSLYIAAVMNTYSRAAPLRRSQRPSVFTLFFMIFASFTFLHSPLESFLKVGPELMTAVMILYALEKARVVVKNQSLRSRGQADIR